jgi:hypothetical protein
MAPPLLNFAAARQIERLRESRGRAEFLVPSLMFDRQIPSEAIAVACCPALDQRDRIEAMRGSPCILSPEQSAKHGQTTALPTF